jgi:hypothetical protein
MTTEHNSTGTPADSSTSIQTYRVRVSEGRRMHDSNGPHPLGLREAVAGALDLDEHAAALHGMPEAADAS